MKISFPDNLSKMTFVDLEASSLHGGWPIELSFAHLHGDGTIQSGAWLIYPDQDWIEDWDHWAGWSDASEAIHRIFQRDGDSARFRFHPKNKEAALNPPLSSPGISVPVVSLQSASSI